MAVHTSNRGYGTGIVDQFLDDRGLTGLSVLMGGGRKWFLPNRDSLKSDGSREGQPLNGSQRDRRSDYELPADIVAGWDAKPGARDPERDLIGRFRTRRLRLRVRQDQPHGPRRRRPTSCWASSRCRT